MSDYQLPKYADARRNEIKVEKKPKEETCILLLTHHIVRIRAFCNFVFQNTRPTL